MQRKLHLCITTTRRSDWRKQVDDLARIGENTAAVFPTPLKLPEREELYGRLVRAGIKDVPHVHLRDDMPEEEAEFLRGKFRTQVFTIHLDHMKFFEKWNGEMRKRLFVELKYANDAIDAGKIGLFGGLCVDTSHFQRACDRNTSECAFLMENAGKKFRVGINHINGILENGKDSHWVYGLRDLDYLDGVPDAMFSDCPCLETENPIADQLKFRDYIEEKFRKRGL